MPVAPDSEDLTILTGGQRLGGWTGIRVSRGVERLPSAFVCELTERFSGQAVANVTPGATCEVFLGADKVLTGYIDVYEPHVDKDNHQVRILGRSKTEDLVDCSLVPEGGVDSWEFKAATIGEAARRIAAPFGIQVSGDAADAQLDQNQPFIIEPGMTCAQLLEEMARNAQVLMWDDAAGNLVFSHVGTDTAETALVEGGNCEVEEARLSMDQRYSDIMVIAQAPVLGQDGQLHLSVLGKAPDGSVPRYRPKLVIMDLPGPDGKWAQQRADWEVSRRYGRSRIVNITVTGWRQASGKLWQANQQVAVNAPSLKVNESQVIAHVSYVRGELGTETVLTCMPAAGLQPAPFHFLPPVPGAT